MKKFLISTIVAALVATLMGVFVACGDTDSDKDADTAQKAISSISNLYGKAEKETKSDYQVLGKAKGGTTLCTVKWSVTSTFTGWQDYIKVGKMDANNEITISITQATEDINYKLKASVTVGKATKSVSFDRVVPAKAATHAGTEADPYTTLNVQEIALGLEGDTSAFYMDGDVAKRVYVEGYVVDPGTHQNGNYLGFIYIVNEYDESKDRNADDAVMIMSVDYDDTFITKASDLAKGDKLKVSGFIQKYIKNATTAPQPEISRWKNPATDKYETVQVISLDKPADNRTEAEKVDQALEATDLVKSYVKTGDITLPAAPTGVTLSWQVKTDANNRVTIAQDMSKFTIAGTLPQDAETVVLTVTATSVADPTVKDSKDITIKIGALKLDHAGTQTDPYSTADVDKILETLADKEVYKDGDNEKKVYVKGYVTDVGEINGTYGLKNVYIADVAEKTAKSVLVFNINWGEALPKPSEIPSDSPLAEGDLIVVSGYLKNYGGTYEIAQSTSKEYPVIVAIGSANDDTSNADKVAAVLATVNATLADVDSTGDVTLPASNNAAVTLSWAITEGGYAGVSVANGKLVVTAQPLPTEADVTLKLKVTATCGTGADAATDDKEVTVVIKKEVDISDITSVSFDFSGITEKGTVIKAEENPLATFKGYLTGNDKATLSAVTVANVYAGNGSGGAPYENTGALIKMGTGKADGQLVLTFKKNVTKVTINCVGWKDTDTIAVNGATPQALNKIDGAKKDCVFNLATNPSKVVTIDTKQRALIFSLVVDFETTNENSPADEKIAAAKEVADTLIENSYVATKTPIALLGTSNGATMTWEVVTGKGVVTIEDNQMTITNPDGADVEDVEIKVTISCEGGEDVEANYTFTVTYVAPFNYGTTTAPISVSAALAITTAQFTDGNTVTEQVVTATGVVEGVPVLQKNGTDYKYTIKDLSDSTKTIIVYGPFNLRQNVVAPTQNDTVIISGYIKKFYNDIEFAVNGETLVYVESNEVGTSTITLTNNDENATVTGITATATNGTVVNFTVEALEGKEVTAVKLNGTAINPTTEGGNSYTFTVAGNMTVTVTSQVIGDPGKNYTYVEVTADNAASLIKDGAVIIITASTKTNSFAMSSQSKDGNWRDSVDFDKDNVSESIVTVTLTAVEGQEGKYYLITNEDVGGGYLTANSSNQVLTNESSSANSVWEIIVGSTGTQIKSANGRWLTYNSTNPRFAAYGNQNQTAATIYVQVEVEE